MSYHVFGMGAPGHGGGGHGGGGHFHGGGGHHPHHGGGHGHHGHHGHHHHGHHPHPGSPSPSPQDQDNDGGPAVNYWPWWDGAFWVLQTDNNCEAYLPDTQDGPLDPYKACILQTYGIRL